MPFDETLSRSLRPMVHNTWPALAKVRCKVGATEWEGSIMPIKDGPLFVAVPKKVRVREGLAVGDTVTLAFTLDPEA